VSLVAVVAAIALPHSARAQSNISPINKWSWGENIGWTNWYDDGITSGAVISTNGRVLSGFIWSEQTGWLYLGDGFPDFGVTYSNVTATDTGVNINAGGYLSGYAWGEQIGWVNFDMLPFAGAALAGRVQLCCPNWRFSGYVWGENVGWINLGDTPFAFIGLATSVQRIRGDLDGNGVRNGMDIAGFIVTLLPPPGEPFWMSCAADMDGSGTVDLADVTPFVNCLLTGVCFCP
jgi:hypothetical protein